MDEWVRDTPKLIEANYTSKYETSCEEFQLAGQTWYKGTGVPPDQHPLKDHIWFGTCGRCGSESVLVLAAQWSVSFSSGDQYWDYEIVCVDCGAFTQRAYAEN